MSIYFNEEQRFTQWWLWLLLTPIAIFPLVGIYQQLIKGEDFGSKPLSDIGLILLALFVFLIIGLLLKMKLTTTIDRTGIRINFFPFIKKHVRWTEIKSAEVVNYGFVGGWGIRMWTKYGTVYNIKGNKGLAIELNNGKKFLIGTQKENELKDLIKKMPLSKME